MCQMCDATCNTDRWMHLLLRPGMVRERTYTTTSAAACLDQVAMLKLKSTYAPFLAYYQLSSSLY